MAVNGDLREMDLTSIISINCNEGNQARLLVENEGKEATIYFADGGIVHMSLDSLEGEEVIDEVLAWREGTFWLELGIPAPKRTVTTGWSELLLSGMQRLDEGAASVEPSLDRKEAEGMAKKNRLAELLEEMAAEIPGFVAAAVVGTDGLPIAQYTTKSFDMETASAQFALVMKLVKKSAAQIGSDEIEDNLVSAKDAYIITRYLGDGSYFLATAVEREPSSLGNVRLVTRMFGPGLWDAIPGQQ